MTDSRARALLVLATLAAPVLLAGCTAADTAAREVEELRTAAEGARRELEEARESYEEVRGRYERVRSLTIVRTERLDVTLTPIVDADRLSFAARAEREGVLVPAANLTRLPLLAVAVEREPVAGTLSVATAADFRCEPLTCIVSLPAGGAALLAWDGESEFRHQVLANGSLRVHRSGAWAGANATEFALARAGEALVTTSAGDATK